MFHRFSDPPLLPWWTITLFPIICPPGEGVNTYTVRLAGVQVLRLWVLPFYHGKDCSPAVMSTECMEAFGPLSVCWVRAGIWCHFHVYWTYSKRNTPPIFVCKGRRITSPVNSFSCVVGLALCNFQDIRMCGTWPWLKACLILRHVSLASSNRLFAVPRSPLLHDLQESVLCVSDFPIPPSVSYLDFISVISLSLCAVFWVISPDSSPSSLILSLVA